MTTVQAPFALVEIGIYCVIDIWYAEWLSILGAGHIGPYPNIHLKYYTSIAFGPYESNLPPKALCTPNIIGAAYGKTEDSVPVKALCISYLF